MHTHTLTHTPSHTHTHTHTRTIGHSDTYIRQFNPSYKYTQYTNYTTYPVKEKTQSVLLHRFWAQAEEIDVGCSASPQPRNCCGYSINVTSSLLLPLVITVVNGRAKYTIPNTTIQYCVVVLWCLVVKKRKRTV